MSVGRVDADVHARRRANGLDVVRGRTRRVDGRRERAGRRVTLRGVLGDRVQHDRLERARDAALRRAHPRSHRRLGHLRREHVEGRRPAERHGADEQLVEDDARRVHVATRIQLVASRLLGRHVLGRAEDHVVLRERGRAGAAAGHDLRHPEVHDDGPRTRLVAPQEDVARFEVAVDHPLCVCFAKRVAHVEQDAHSAVDWEQTFSLEHGVERRPIDPGEHHVE